tara:strand:- start:3935 stop:4618 length:684 start_codon:yes stop_codon:yes gene_type:complete
MNFELTQEEARVMGCLLEKAVTTPDQYPLTLNALTNACNQKSSRDPVMSLEQGVVQRTTRNLEGKYLLRTQEGNKVEKYIQRLCNTPMAKWQFNSAEYAIVTLLLLRGPQTPGELRARAGRLHTFENNAAVSEVLEAFMNREDGALVSRLPRKAGRQDHEYMHLFSGEIESVAMEAPLVSDSPSPRREDKIEKLEARVSQLEAALVTLAEKLGETVVLGVSDSEDGV